jgi:hypothetical protein
MAGLALGGFAVWFTVEIAILRELVWMHLQVLERTPEDEGAELDCITGASAGPGRAGELM